MTYTLASKIWIMTFLIAMTISFSPQLPDMDYMPRMLTSSFFVLPFAIMAYLAVKQNEFTLPRSLHNNIILISFFIFLIILFKSHFNSINPNDSLFDVLKFALAILYLVLFSILFFKSSDPFQIISRSLIISNSIVLIAGGWQVYTLILDAKKNNYPFRFDYHMSSLLSTKNSLAEFFLLVLPFIIYAIIKDKGVWKIAAIINAFFCLLSIYLLNSFSVYLALMAAILLVSVLLFSTYKEWLREKTGLTKKVFSRAIPLLFTALIFTLFLTMNKADGFKKLKIAATYLSGKTTTERFNNNSTFERLLLWKNSISMIKEHPIAGVGLSNWKLLFPSYGYSGASYLNGDTVKFTRPHNDFLQVFAEAGLLGFLSYLLFFISAIYITTRNYLKTKDINWLFLLSGGIIFFVVSLFGFPMERVFILMLIIIYFSLTIALNAKLNNAKKYTGSGKWVLITVVSLLLSFFSIKVCMARIGEEATYNKMVYLKVHGNWQRMYQLAVHSSWEYFPIDYVATPVNWYVGTGAYMNNNLKEALIYFKKAEEEAPYHVQIKNDIGATYLNSGDYKTSQKYFSDALALNPRFFEAKLNNTFAVFNSGNKYGAYQMLKGLYDKDKRPQKYYENMAIVLNAVSDSVFKAANINLKTDPVWATKFNNQYMWSVERTADTSKLSFIDILNKELNLYK